MKRNRLLYEIPESAEPDPGKDDDVIAVSMVAFADGKDHLCIDLWWRGWICARYFADRKTHNAFMTAEGRWNTLRLENVARKCKGYSPRKNDFYYYYNEMSWASKEDEKRAADYLDNISVGAWENEIYQKKCAGANKRKEAKIEHLMAQIPPVPDGMEVWIRQQIFPEQFLFFRRDNLEYSCSCCGGTGRTEYRLKHGQTAKCPKCGMEARVWTRKTVERSAVVPVVLLQAYEEETEMKAGKLKIPIKKLKWVERQFHAEVTWKWGKKKQVRLYEELRAVIDQGKTWGKVYYGLDNEADEFEQEFWDKNPANKHFLKSLLYPDNLKDALSIGNLQNSGMIEMAEKSEKFNVNHWITEFYRNPYLEYLAKAGLTRLAAEAVDTAGGWENPVDIRTDAKNIKEALMLDGNRVNRLKVLDGGIVTLTWLKWEQAQELAGKKAKITAQALEILDKKGISPASCKEILEAAGSVNRMANYLGKQKGRADDLIRTWSDYLRMAGEDGMDVTDDIVRFPKDLKARHDQLVEIRNNRKNQEKYDRLNAKIMQRLPEAEKYFWENKKYMIIPAGKCEELVHEGRALHHCVGSSTRYMDRMAAGISWILFLRKKGEHEKPYYTIEIDMKDNHIIQWYSEFDRKPDSEAVEALLKSYTAKFRREKLQAAV